MLRRLVSATVLILAAAAAQKPSSDSPPSSPTQPNTYTLPPEKLQKAIDYANARNRLHFIGVAWGIVTIAGVLAWRVAPRFRDWAQTASGRPLAQAFVFAPFLLLIDVLILPIDIYRQRLARIYDQSIQGWGSWLWDWSKGEAIGLIIAVFGIWIMYEVIRRSRRHWWFYFWLLSVPVILFFQFITPVLIEPMFFKFEPLATRQPALVADIQKVVARGGLDIPPAHMFEMNASEKVKSLNAYVSGIGASKRVVVWDTTIKRMTPAQTLFVFGHEMGHYVLGHMWILIATMCLSALISLFVGSRAMEWMLAHWGDRWGVKAIDDLASLPVLMLAVTVLGFLGEPVLNSFSRVLEHDADVYGLEVIHGLVPNSSEVGATSFQILGEVALADPNPEEFIKFWLYNHPSVADRMRFASEYDPWSTGQRPKYVP